MPLKETIAVLAATPLPPLTKKTLAVGKVMAKIAENHRAVADANARIVFLEAQLGKPHGSPMRHLSQMLTKVEWLEQQLALKAATTDTAAPAPSLATPTAADPAPVLAPAKAIPAIVAAAARQFEPTGSPALDKAMQARGAHNLSSFKAKVRCDELEADAARYPAGSMTRKAIESNLEKARLSANS